MFPSGATLTFRIPDSGALLRSGLLPDRLRTTALLCAAHPEGPDGYMADLVMQAVVSAERSELVSRAIEDGMGLANVLVAEMLVKPEVTVEEVASGAFPELDIKMLLDFAERKRNTDAAVPPNRLPITVLSGWATFRDERPGLEGAASGGPGGPADGADVPEPDGAPV